VQVQVGAGGGWHFATPRKPAPMRWSQVGTGWSRVCDTCIIITYVILNYNNTGPVFVVVAFLKPPRSFKTLMVNKYNS
jgi:hypothetical protein